MPIFAGADYYTQDPQETEDQPTPIAFEEMEIEKLDTLVNKAALSNQDQQAEALRKADSYAFQVAHPEFLRTANNTRLINHLLQTWGITNPTYPDFDRAYEFLKDSPLLDIDKAELARQQDDKQPRTFTGVFTKRTFDSLDDLISNERLAALQQVPQVSPEEIALDGLPIEEVQTILRAGERAGQQKVNAKQSQQNANVWLTLHPEFSDSKHNAELMKLQLASNGVLENVATVADYELAYKQLRVSGLLALDKKEVRKQQAEELQQRAAQVVKTPGSVFDQTTEEEMYNLPMEELERRARGNFSGR